MKKMKRSVQIAAMPDVSATVPTGTNGLHLATDSPQVADAAVAQPPRDNADRSRAYDLYCERGCIDGFHLDDWYQADGEVPSPVATVNPAAPAD